MEMSDYWQKRQQQLNAAMEKDEAALRKRLESFYRSEYRKFEKEIAAYYTMYGENKVIEYRNLMQNLPEEDKRRLIERMQDFTQLYPEYADMLPIRESIYKLNRLEGLQYSVLMQLYEIGAVNNEQISKHLTRQAMRGANAAAEALGFGKNFYAINPDIVEKFVNAPWSNGENFSQRIWKNTEKLANILNTDIAQGFARGDSYDRLTRHLRQRFENVSRKDAYRLIYTEGTYVMAESAIQFFTEDFEKYRLSTVEDGKVCDICRGIAKEVFDIADRTPGVNFPPLHPWCRCTFEIVVDDWDEWLDNYLKKHSGDRKKAETIENRLKSGSQNRIIKLPRYQEAVIPKDKFLEYALNPQKDPDKARAFKSALGYTTENADELMQQIYDQLPRYKAVERGDRGWGMTYEVVIEIIGPNGKTAKVLTAWIDDKQNGEMRLTTVHVDD